MSLYIDNINFDAFLGVYLEMSEPDLEMPTYNTVITNVRGRLIGQVRAERNITPGSMKLVFTGCFNTLQAKEEFNATLNSIFNVEGAGKVHNIQLPTDTNTHYKVVLDGNISVSNPSSVNVRYGVNTYKAVKRYEIPLKVLQIIKK